MKNTFWTLKVLLIMFTIAPYSKAKKDEVNKNQSKDALMKDLANSTSKQLDLKSMMKSWCILQSNNTSSQFLSINRHRH